MRELVAPPDWPRWFGVVLVGLIGVVAVYAYLFDGALFDYLVSEDNVLENLTAGLLLFGSMLWLFRFFKYQKGKDFWWKAFQLFFAVLLFFGFAEEISWGQRIIGFDTPEFFAKNNKQYEVGIHNLTYKGFSVNQWIFSFGLTIVIAIYYLFFRILYQKVNWIKQLTDLLGVPLPGIQQTIMMVAVVLLILLIQHPKKWEIFECLFVIVFLISIYVPNNYKKIWGRLP